MARGVAPKRSRHPVPEVEGMKVRMPCSITSWRRGIESEGTWLYYRLEERDRKRGNMALLQAVAEG